MFSAQLAKHLKHKERYPEDAANEMRKKRSCLALDTGNGPRLTREQYFDTTKEYDIPEPPDYPQVHQMLLSMTRSRLRLSH